MTSKTDTKRKISGYQLKAMIICNTVSSGVIFLPKIFFGCSIINLLICFCFIFVIIKFINIVTDNNLFDKNILEDKSKKILSVLLFIKILLSTVFGLNIFSRISKIYILEKTPACVINLILLLACFYLVYKGYETRARLGEILVWLIILPLAIVLFVSLSDIFFDFKNIIFNGGLKIDLIRSFKSIFVFSQLDYLFLCDSYLDKNKKTPKKILGAFIFSFLIIILLTCIIKSRINFETAFPITELMSVTDIPGGFIQNQDFFVVTFIITAFFSLISSGLFFMSEILFNLGIAKKKCLWISSCILFIISLFTDDSLTYFFICVLGSVFYFLLSVLFAFKSHKIKREAIKD